MTDRAASSPATDADLLPVRMLSEYAYCPRLYHLMRVEGLWADNRYTAEGRRAHRRVDRLDHVLPDPAADAAKEEDAAGEDPPAIARSVPLSCPELGLTAKLDLVSTAGEEAVPVETKRGKVPANPERSWEPERVQLMAQGLLLRGHGYRSDHGVLYFAASRTRVEVPFTPELEARTRELIAAARLQATSDTMPPPLEDSPKCPGCSLVGICLPDETHALSDTPPDPEAPRVRRLYPVRDDAGPLYVQEQGAYVGKKDATLVVRKQGAELARARLKDVGQLVLLGSVQISAQALHACCEAGVPVVHTSTGHWFSGITAGITLRNAFDRAAQFRIAAEEDRCLALAKAFVAAKGANQRTLLRRNADPSPAEALKGMASLLGRIDGAESAATLLGLEGSLARHYFGAFPAMCGNDELAFDMAGRNRRPPTDPVNALLSFGYAMLAKDCTVALLAVGLDPYWGFFHRPRHGRPALALDLMEEFRPLVVDSAVITAINTGMVARKDFTVGRTGCLLKPPGRKAYIRAFEARMDQLATHPRFGYRVSWRTLIRLQAQILARHLRGDLPAYAGITTR